MIKYQLRCDVGHEFEGWFRSSETFDQQAGSGLLACPSCGSRGVRRAIMAPAVARRAGASTAGDGDAPSDARSARLAEIRHSIREAAQRARDYVEKNFDYVGGRFPEEARRIHYGETDPRPIYGEASGREVRDLVAEGVEIAPLPGVATTQMAEPASSLTGSPTVSPAAPPAIAPAAPKKLN